VLQKYAWDKGLIPGTQIAVQQGVQPGDLTTFLRLAHTALALALITAYCIKRDHLKGFDKLLEQAFYDAIEYYGLPRGIIEFERARTRNISMRVKSQDGIGERSFSTTGQNRQGDPISPFKYVLAMAMLIHWMTRDKIVEECDVPVLRTFNGTRGHAHTLADRLMVRLIAVEAMDDSILAATSWRALQKMVGLSEQFQTAYGIQTAWESPDKTVCFTIGVSPLDITGPAGDDKVKFITPDGTKLVPITRQPEMLRTAFLDSDKQLADALEIVANFPIPVNRTMPIALLRRAVSGLLVPRLRARLSFLPLPHKSAQELQKAITRRILVALEITFKNGSSILYLPIKNNGFGFPSIVNINAELAVKAVMRSLNHHLTQFKTMGQITLANWECVGNSCSSPFEILQPSTDRPIRAGKEVVPHHWMTAMESLAQANIRVVQTDTSDWTRWSLQHIVNRLRYTTSHEPPTAAIDKIIRARFTVAESHGSGIELLKRIVGPPKDLKLNNDLLLARQTVVKWYSTLNFPQDLSTMDSSTFTPVSQRRKEYDAIIRTGLSRTPEIGDGKTWASDGSHIEGEDGPSTVGALVGPLSGAFGIEGQYTSSLHGERLAAIAALIATRLVKEDNADTRLLTDHLETVRLAMRVRTKEYRLDTWRERPGHELYAWLALLLRTNSITISHIKAHTGKDDEESRMNELADTKATDGHGKSTLLPPLTGWMKSYVMWSPVKGYVPDNWVVDFRQALVGEQLNNETEAMQQSLRYPEDNKTGEPIEYYYTKAPSGTTGKFQLMLRMNQFPTRKRQCRDKIVPTPKCDLCDAEIQDEKHIFVDCPAFASMREEGIRKAFTFRKPCDKEETEVPKEQLTQYYREVVFGSDRWVARPWLGLVPIPQEPLNPRESGMAHHLAIILTSRIAGEYFRKRERAKAQEGGTIPIQVAAAPLAVIGRPRRARSARGGSSQVSQGTNRGGGGKK
jgi:hypothetical protein